MSLELNKRELLRYLLSHPDTSYEELMAKLGLSKRSIRLLIESLLYSYHHIFSIQEVDGEVKLTVLDSAGFEALLSQDLLAQTDLNSFHKRQALCFYELLKSEDYLSAEDIAEDLGISRRSLSRDLQRMRETLEGYQLSLESKTGVGIRLVGSELHKRLLYLYEVIDYLESPPVLPEEMLETYRLYLENQEFPLSIRKVFLSTLEIAWERREHEMQEEDLQWFTYREQAELPEIVYDVLKFFWGRDLNQLERIFITLPLQVGVNQSKIQNPAVSSLAKAVLKETVQEFGLSLPIEESAELLEAHLIYLLNRNILHWEYAEISIREDLVRSAFPSVVARYMLGRMSQVTGVILSSREEVLLAAWMELLLARQQLPLISRVAVIAQAGSSFQFLVRNQFQVFFGAAVVVDFFDFTNHPSYTDLERKYDLVFTDNLLYSVDRMHSTLSLSLVTKDNQEERERLERTVLSRKIQFACQVYEYQMDASASYEDNLARLSQALVKEGVLTAESRELLLAKEESDRSLAATGYAFPHLTADDLAQMTLVTAKGGSQGIQTKKKQEIHDFLLLLIPKQLDEDQQDLLYKIFDNLFRQVTESSVQERLGLDQLIKRTVGE